MQKIFIYFTCLFMMVILWGCDKKNDDVPVEKGEAEGIVASKISSVFGASAEVDAKMLEIKKRQEEAQKQIDEMQKDRLQSY